jgi:hypothetical protein
MCRLDLSWIIFKSPCLCHTTCIHPAIQSPHTESSLPPQWCHLCATPYTAMTAPYTHFILRTWRNNIDFWQNFHFSNLFSEILCRESWQQTERVSQRGLGQRVMSVIQSVWLSEGERARGKEWWGKRTAEEKVSSRQTGNVYSWPIM